MISSVVDLVGLQGKRVGGARYYTEIAPFAALDVDGDCTLYFCHIWFGWLVEKLMFVGLLCAGRIRR